MQNLRREALGTVPERGLGLYCLDCSAGHFAFGSDDRGEFVTCVECGARTRRDFRPEGLSTGIDAPPAGRCAAAEGIGFVSFEGWNGLPLEDRIRCWKKGSPERLRLEAILADRKTSSARAAVLAWAAPPRLCCDPQWRGDERGDHGSPDRLAAQRRVRDRGAQRHEMKFKLEIDIEPAADPILTVCATLRYLSEAISDYEVINRHGIGTALPIRDRRGDPIGHFLFSNEKPPADAPA